MDFNVNLGFETCLKAYDKSMDFERKNKKIREKNESPKKAVWPNKNHARRGGLE